MAIKWEHWLAVIILLGIIAVDAYRVTPTTPTTTTPPQCGKPVMNGNCKNNCNCKNQNQCTQNANCAWSNMNPNKPYCYNKCPNQTPTPTPPTKCGKPVMNGNCKNNCNCKNQNQCTQNANCAWSNMNPNKPYCYNKCPVTNPNPLPPVPASNCGKPAMMGNCKSHCNCKTPNQCAGNAYCAWSNKNPKKPFCYYKCGTPKVTWCGGPKAILIKPHLTFNPIVIIAGGTILITLTGVLLIIVVAGTVRVNINLNGKSIFTNNYDLCQAAQSLGVSCPFQKGPMSLTVLAHIPNFSNHGAWEGEAVVTSNTGAEIACYGVTYNG